MFQPIRLLFFAFVILFVSCKTDNKYTYAIKDFRNLLQPSLINMVSKGIVGFYSDSLLYSRVTDKELKQLSNSEHQVLRAWAFRTMLNRTSFNHFDLVMNHLDDTAIVGVDHGEFGILYQTVSDYILEEAQWKNISSKNKTIDKVLMEHNYLKSAYTIIEKIEPQEKYYAYIKDMATRRRNYNEEEYGEEGFNDIEYALYGLAKFKRKEDIKIIKELLLTNDWRMTEISFTLMKEFPDTAYLDVYEKYYPGRYYGSICRERSLDKAPAFINSIAVYKNVRSAKILDSILNKKPFINCQADTSYLKNELFYAIWNNPCEAYSKLRKQVALKIKQYEKGSIQVQPIEPLEFSVDTFAKRIGWLK